MAYRKTRAKKEMSNLPESDSETADLIQPPVAETETPTFETAENPQETFSEVADLTLTLETNPVSEKLETPVIKEEPKKVVLQPQKEVKRERPGPLPKKKAPRNIPRFSKVNVSKPL